MLHPCLGGNPYSIFGTLLHLLGMCVDTTAEVQVCCPQDQSPQATQIYPSLYKSISPTPSNFLPSSVGLMERYPGFLLRG